MFGSRESKVRSFFRLVEEKGKSKMRWQDAEAERGE